MKGIISSQSAMTARRQTDVDPAGVDPVSVPQTIVPPAPSARGGAVSGTRRAARVSSTAEPRTVIAAVEPAIDYAKVERLRTALAAGTLKIDSQLVAERLIDRDE